MTALVSEGATALEAIAEPLSMAEWQAKLLEKLDLSGLKNWAPRNTEAAEQLVMSYHDVFALDKNGLGCTSAVEHEIHIIDSEPFKERFNRIPPPLLEEVWLPQGICWMQAPYIPANHCGVTLSCW